MKHKFLVFLIFIGIAALLLVGGLPRWRRHLALAHAAEQKRNAAIPVVVMKPRLVKDPGILLPGSMVAAEVATVNARGAGYVVRWYADIGATVRAGQVLADVEAPEVEAQFRQAQAQTAQTRATEGQAIAETARLRAGVMQSTAQRDASAAALMHARATALSFREKILEAQRSLQQTQANQRLDQAQLVMAQRSYLRYKTLGAQGYVTQQEVDQAQATYDSAVAKVQADQSAVRTAEAAVDDARANLRAALSDVHGSESNLRAAGESIRASEAALESGNQSVAATRANIAASVENEKRYGVLQGFQKVVAPFDGVITARNVDVGTLINPAATTVPDTDPNNTAPKSGLFGVARLNPLLINVAIPQTFSTSIRVGQRCEVYVRELPGEKFIGRLSALGGALDAASRTLQGKIMVSNPIGRLRPGMYAQVRIQGLNVQPVVHIPASALLYDASGTRVVVVDHNRVHLRTVRIGRDYGAEIEVLEGLQGKEDLVTNPSDDLTEGTAVEVARATADSPAQSGGKS